MVQNYSTSSQHEAIITRQQGANTQTRRHVLRHKVDQAASRGTKEGATECLGLSTGEYTEEPHQHNNEPEDRHGVVIGKEEDPHLPKKLIISLN